MEALPELVHSVKVRALPEGSRDELTDAWKAWVQEAGAPPGGALSWAFTSPPCLPLARGRAVLASVGAVGTPAPRPLKNTCALPARRPRAVQLAGAIPPGNAPGENRWAQRRPRAAKPEVKLTPGKGIEDLTCSMEELLDQVVKGCKVVAFVKGTRTAPQCGFSHKMLTMLTEVWLMPRVWLVVGCC